MIARNNETTLADIDAQKILGKHIDDKGDNDVNYIAIANNSFFDGAPKNVFVRFENVEQFAFFNTSLKILRQSYFESATKLKYVWLHNNEIYHIEEQCFSNLSETLENLILSNNHLGNLYENTFGRMNALTDLYLNGNVLKKLNANIFSQLTTLYRLSLVRNNIIEIDEKAFINLNKLQVLYLDFNEIQELALNIFKPLKRLNLLSLNNNLLVRIDKELFDSFEKLAYIEIRNNRLKHIDFFAKLPKLVQLDLSFNQISAIEQFDVLENIKEINLLGNICVSKIIKSNFSNELGVCFQNYQIPMCKFYIDKKGYTCDVIAETIKNPNLIINHHVVGYNNDDVQILKVNKIIENFSLSLLLEKFEYLNEIYIYKSKVFDLLEQNILKTIDYRYIRYQIIKHNIFSSCHELENLLILNSNLKGLTNELFDGITNMKFIDFSFNELINDDLQKLKNLSSLLKLHLSGNYISEISESYFENMKLLKISIELKRIAFRTQ
ncbi:hypothetical protein PVAND_007487 [Polypedilum vanderplanki]|uniref:Uncharacterized protein n=1 Tax=Polypedilum vanderplanki TaxID=319348 RepID=A0A9J6C6G0_POLVA|nr:hypothetical protein PVAND_007487 [Polypedilum vanderplanki]